jgi:hypothetical protein
MEISTVVETFLKGGLKMKDYLSVKVGDLILLAVGGWSKRRYLQKVARLTKTQLIMTKGERFNRQTGRQVAGFDNIYSIAPKDINKFLYKCKIEKAVFSLSALVSGNSKKIKENIDDILIAAKKVKKLLQEE